eukprot:Lithocolla_globosa_v1_NODE_1294_length_2695_cov_6.288258.p4 type:complete len:115 gc:universal NODE_1294_length_2695_cov_6.288258:1261-1605(+)
MQTQPTGSSHFKNPIHKVLRNIATSVIHLNGSNIGDVRKFSTNGQKQILEVVENRERVLRAIGTRELEKVMISIVTFYILIEMVRMRGKDTGGTVTGKSMLAEICSHSLSKLGW